MQDHAARPKRIDAPPFGSEAMTRSLAHRFFRDPDPYGHIRPFAYCQPLAHRKQRSRDFAPVGRPAAVLQIDADRRGRYGDRYRTARVCDRKMRTVREFRLAAPMLRAEQGLQRIAATGEKPKRSACDHELRSRHRGSVPLRTRLLMRWKNSQQRVEHWRTAELHEYYNSATAMRGAEAGPAARDNHARMTSSAKSLT